MTRPPLLPRWPLRSLALALVVAGLVHIGTILVLAHARGTDAYRRVEALNQGGAMQTFAPPAGAERFVPYRDPAMAEAFCRFDLRHGGVLVSLPVTPLDFAAVSVHGADGRVVYALTNGAAVGGAITLSLAWQGAASGADDGLGSVPKVVLRRPDGFVAVQALADMPGLRATAEAAVHRLACRPAKP